jgi:hypothetical protein
VPVLFVPEAPADAPAPARRLRYPLALVASAYLVVSLVLHHRVLGGLTTTAIGTGTTDHDLFVWWLNWTPWALLHGENPLLTDHQHYPLGVNAMWNTSVPLLGVVLAPVTWAAGPVAAYNVGIILGPVVSGVALVAALGPYVRHWLPRTVGGAMYAFGPFHLAHASVGHLNLVWSVLPPVLLYLVHVLFVRRLRRPLLVGAAVGAVLAAQTVLYTQTLGTGVLLLVVAAAVLAVQWPRRAREALPSLVRAGLACVGTYAVLCAYPLYLILAGPVRPRGQIRDPEYSGADLANALVPTRLTAIRPVPDGLAERLQSHTGEQGGYLGVAVLVLLAVAVLAGSTAIRLTAAVGALAFVLSLGPTLVVLGEPTGIPLPWRLLTEVPLLSQAEPVRLQVFVTLCVAVIVAMWLERLPALPTATARGAAAGLTAAALVSWLPADAQFTQPATAPAFFATAARHLQPDDVVETYPRLSSAWEAGAAPLRWQALSGLAYRTTGGYFIGSDSDDDVLIESPLTSYQVGAGEIAQGRPAPGEARLAAARGELRASGTTVVIVAPPADAAILDWTARVTGSPGTLVEDVWLFRLR